MKDFNNDFELLFNLLKNKINFSFSKYADGEYEILKNNYITNCDNWTFNPKIDQLYRDNLIKSFTFNEKGYYVGISCPCCVNLEDVEWMRKNVCVSDEYLTWANIFVNGNYNNFKNKFIAEFENHDIIIVANANANILKLPFKVEEHIKISNCAWKDNFDLVEKLPKIKYNNKLFLFCAGPLGNMLSAEMWKKNKNNTYLDIGSTLNPWLVGNNRGYLNGGKTLKKKCIW